MHPIVGENIELLYVPIHPKIGVDTDTSKPKNIQHLE